MNELAVKFFLWLGRYSVPAIFFAVEVLAAVILIAVAVWLKQQGARIKKTVKEKTGITTYWHKADCRCKYL